MGQYSIKLKNSEFLYRCLEALGWLGCSAIKRKRIHITSKCLEGLVQLGRESRASNLKCFWSRCALSPEDHAIERIEWMLSWVRPSNDTSEEPFGLKKIEKALSRFYGYEYTIDIEEENGKINFKIKESKKKYTEIIISEGQTKTIDYSDSNVLDEFAL